MSKGFSIVSSKVNSNTDSILDGYREAIKNNQNYFTLPKPTRKLKASYTMEMMEDLKSFHGINAEQELINIMKAELAKEN